MPTIRPQSVSPHCAIATTPWPFAVNQVPAGLVVGVADADNTLSPSTSIATQQASARDLAWRNIEPTPVVTIGRKIFVAGGVA
jgi:hypothetical protein